MKKLFLLSALTLLALTGKAQLTLTGSSYTQNFDNIGGGLPTGWAGYKAATSSTLGILTVFNSSAGYGAYYDTTACASSVFGYGHKNCASATAVNSTVSCSTQTATLNRAFGVRQTSGTGTHPGYDPGASFVLHLANTTGLTSFSASFLLQSLDKLSARVTTWSVDYGIGASPSVFVAAGPVGNMNTGGSTFSNNTITVNFGSALDNQSQDVWIRISALSNSTGGGNRTTSAIDDFVLNYSVATGISGLAAQQQMTFKVLGEAKSDKVFFECTTEKGGLYNLNIYDMSGRQVYTKQIDMDPAQNNITINDWNLTRGMYTAKISNGTVLGTAKVLVQ